MQRRTGDVPLVVQVGYEAFLESLARRLLPGGVLYKVHGVPSAAEANRVMRQVRAVSLLNGVS